MDALFHVNMFWWGESLSQIELASMLSVQRCGHDVTLYAYNSPENLPHGIAWQNASEILPRDKFMLFKNSQPALGSDLFRYHLMAQSKGLWMDTDVLLLQPIIRTQSDVFGWQDELRINGAVLYLAQEGKLLADIMAFVAEEFPIPAFYSERVKQQLAARKHAGQTVHVKYLPWGVWGPDALTHYIGVNGLAKAAKPPPVFYPVHWSHAHHVFSSHYDITEKLQPETLAIHLWNAVLRKSSTASPDATPGKLMIDAGSYFETFCRKELGLRVQSET